VVPRLAMSVEMIKLETHFPKNALLQLGGWFQTGYFNQEKDISMLMKHVQKYEITNGYLKRKHFLVELWTGHLEHLQCPTM
jgi:hypothetical protein